MSDEHEWNVGKALWLQHHRWRTPPAEARLEIAGHIGQATFENIHRVLEQDPLAPIYASIESNGGDPFEAMRCYRALRAHRSPVHARVASRCSSAALLVLAAADQRTAAPIARFQLHNAEYALRRLGRHTAAVLRADAAGLDEVDEEMVSILALRCGRYPHWQLAADLAAETVLDAHQSSLRGLLTESPK